MGITFREFIFENGQVEFRSESPRTLSSSGATITHLVEFTANALIYLQEEKG